MPIEREQYGSGVSDPYMSIPVSEFENLHEHIRVLRLQTEKMQEAAAGLLTALHEGEDEITSLRQAVRWNEEQRGIQSAEIERLRTELAGYRWGESNAAAEEHSLGWPEDDDDGGHEGSND